MKKLAALSLIQCLVFTTASLLTSPPLSAATPQPAHEHHPRTPLRGKHQIRYVDPVSGKNSPEHVLRPFIKTTHNWQRGHRGIDLEMKVGGNVLSAGAGTVSFAGSVAGRPSVSIVHPDGVRTTYTPVHSRVITGQHVNAGEAIGTLAPASDGFPGLHWGALIAKDSYINPLSLLDKPMIRLKTVPQ